MQHFHPSVCHAEKQLGLCANLFQCCFTAWQTLRAKGQCVCVAVCVCVYVPACGLKRRVE